MGNDSTIARDQVYGAGILPYFERYVWRTPLQAAVVAILVAQAIIWSIVLSPQIGLYAVILAVFVLILAVNIELYVLATVLVIPWAWQSMAIQVGPVSLKATYVLIALGFCGLLYRIATTKGMRWVRTPLDMPLLIFLGISLLSVGISTDPAWSLRETVQTAVYIVYFFLMTNVLTTEESVRRAANTIILATVSVAVIGMSGALGHGVTHTGGFQRMLAGFTDPNLSANYLLAGFPLAFALALGKYKDFSTKLLYSAATVLLGVGLVLTYSRAGWAIGIVALLLVSFLAKTAFKGIAILIAVVVVLGLLGAPSLQERVVQTASLSESSNLSHFYLWKSAWTVITSHPILGVGAGAFPIFFSRNFGTSVLPPTEILGKQVYFSSMGENGVLAHNAFLQMWAEIGSFGFIVFLFIIARFLKTTVARLNDIEQEHSRLLLVGLLSAFTAVVLHNLSITNLIDHFWAVLGIGMAGARVIGLQRQVKHAGINA